MWMLFCEMLLVAVVDDGDLFVLIESVESN